MKKQYCMGEWAGLGLASTGAWLGGKNGLYVSINKVRRNRHKVSERDLPDWQAELHMPRFMSFPVANAEDLIVGLREGARLFSSAANELAKDIEQRKAVPEKDRQWLEDNGFSMSSAGVFERKVGTIKLSARYYENGGWIACSSEWGVTQRADTAEEAVCLFVRIYVGHLKDEQEKADKGISMLKSFGECLKEALP